MSGGETVRDRVAGIPVRDIHVTVSAGPDKGKTATGHDEPITVGTGEGNTVTVADRTVSRHHVEISRHGDRIAVTDLGSTNGTRMGPVLIEGATAAVEAGTKIRLGRTEVLVENGELVQRASSRRREVAGIRGASEAMQRIMERVELLAAKDAPILVVGESGTGKELVARALHELGPRRDKAFVTVDCGAIPQNLFESALFGHVRGAFTGADRDREGAFAQANGGTIFLDEIGELAPIHQTSLLGVLERRTFQPVGTNEDRAVDVRVVAATNRDLRAEVNQESFRLDLYYRLAVVTLSIPPLRNRPEDVPILVDRFLIEEGYDDALDKVFPGDAMTRLLAYR